MRIKVYRGTKEIGGTCIEITADNGKKIWVDLGSPLSNENPDIEYAKNSVDPVPFSNGRVSVSSKSDFLSIFEVTNS